MINKRHRDRWIVLSFGLAWILAYSMLVAPVALAHGGEPGHVSGPLTPWLVALTYFQMVMAPFVGVWLLREAIAAWRAPLGGTDKV